MKKVIFNFLLVMLAVSITGCGKLTTPTYPKDEIPNAIKTLCRKEYGITERVDVKIAGKTLGVRIHLDGLVDINLKLQEEALDKLQKLLRIIRRVCLSTDADLDFYVIIGFEKRFGIEVVFYSYVTDLQKAVARWMSPEDYFQRLIKTMRLDTLRWGNTRINKLIKDLEDGNMITVIVNNFATGTKLSNLDPRFLQILTDLGKKSYIKWHLLKQYSLAVGAQKRLYYVEAKEHFTPAVENAEELSYPSGTIHRLYILISLEELNPVIDGIFSGEALPEAYWSLGPPSTWVEDEFFTEDFVFHKFLATQIVQRIQFELSKDKEGQEKEEAPLFTLEGDFIVRDKIDTEVKLKDPSENTFRLIFKPKKSSVKDLAIPKTALDLAIKTIREVCNKYKFYDLGEVQFQDNRGNSLLTLDKLSLFKN